MVLEKVAWEKLTQFYIVTGVHNAVQVILKVYTLFSIYSPL